MTHSFPQIKSTGGVDENVDQSPGEHQQPANLDASEDLRPNRDHSKEQGDRSERGSFFHDGPKHLNPPYEQKQNIIPVLFLSSRRRFGLRQAPDFTVFSWRFRFGAALRGDQTCPPPCALVNIWLTLANPVSTGTPRPARPTLQILQRIESPAAANDTPLRCNVTG
jgi:hypothetical protein